ncbi:MAG: GNAT family N-acetyltransferase [Candidatus Obscuribacterales bacterium]|nr:GNAT family N-acetyltransferase [Steroidobacteraceae bacterium]
MGELQTRHLSEPAATHAHLEHFFNQHTQRWQRAGFHSQFDDPAQREFFQRLTDTLGSRGWLRFSTVSVGEQMLAYHFGFDYGGRLTWYKPAFNPRYADHSPGLVLIQALIQEALRTGRDEFDLTVGAEPFKLRFSNLVRSNAYVSVFHGRGRYTVAMALHYLRALARSIVRPVRGKWRALRAGSRSMKQLKQ